MQFTDIYDPSKLASIIDTIVTCLKGVEFDTVVGRGLSGAIVVPMVALRLNKKFAIVRKLTPTHGNAVEGDCSGRAVIVDDWVSSGDTLRKCLAICNNCVGVYLYAYAMGTKGLTTYLNSKGFAVKVLN